VNELKIYNDTIDLVLKLLETRPLNGKLEDIRHKVRFQAVTLLNIFHPYIRSDEI